jgi:hypothetical protein
LYYDRAGRAWRVDEFGENQPFPNLFANFALALYTDSLPGLGRTTAPAADQFMSRNVRQMWNRLFVARRSRPGSVVVFPTRHESDRRHSLDSVLRRGRKSAAGRAQAATRDLPIAFGPVTAARCRRTTRRRRPFFA